MAIQEVEVSKHGAKTGFKREINEGAMGLVLDTIQITQYSKPEESTVRELTANAVDSQREKEIAIKILSGEAKVEDYYLERDGAKYADSNWDSSYYSLNHLDRNRNKVELEYIEGEGTGYCDQFIIRDYGVGIGANRLEGYFQIGYSTKRNSKASLGAFGFGNKVALSTRCDYYTVTTVHNGMRFKFNCYSYKIDSLVPKFNLETGETNDYITFADGSKIYYEKTEQKNFTEIIVPTKRHHRSKYRQAVRSQLLYFSNVTYTIFYEGEYGGKNVEDFQAKVLYNSDRLIVSNNNQFSKPHVVIVKGEKDEKTAGVCYGFIDFQEMEMQQLYGNVGVKCPIRSVIRDEATGVETVLQEGVEVTPSRESVVWSEHTRNFLIQRFQEAVEEATSLIQDEINVDDFLEWMGKCSGVKNKASNGDNEVLYQLSKVINIDDISPSYKETNIKLSHPDIFFRGLRVRYCYSSYDHKKRRDVIRRDDLKRWGDFIADKVYLKSIPTSTKIDHFINSTKGSFITIEVMDAEQTTREYLHGPNRVKDDYLEACLEVRDEIVKLIKKSSKCNDYDTIVVPEDFGKEVEEAEEEDRKIELSAAERRKLSGKIPLHNMVPNSTYHNTYSKTDHRPFTFCQSDESVSDLLDEFEGELIYGFNDDIDHLMLLGQILDAQTPRDIHHYSDYSNTKFNNDKLRVIRISKQNEKHFKNNERFKHVSDFFQKIENCDEQ